MTAFKLTLANLVMWVRDTYFPATHAQTTWHRLEPFFRLPGSIVWGTLTVAVELRTFNDQHLTRDLAGLLQRTEAALPRLSNGRQLCFSLAGTSRLHRDGHLPNEA